MALFRNMIDHIYRSIGWLIVLLLLAKLNRNHLRHIESIKYYRNDIIPNKALEETSDSARCAEPEAPQG